jgi:hypothetical protein
MAEPVRARRLTQRATTRPTKPGRPFTRWSIRKPADHLRSNVARPIRIGREALRCLLARRGVTFQRTKTWKESSDPDFDTELDRIEYAVNERPDRTLALGGQEQGRVVFHADERRITPTTPSRRGIYTATCPGATRTPGTRTFWPPSAANAPASAARKASAGRTTTRRLNARPGVRSRSHQEHGKSMTQFTKKG